MMYLSRLMLDPKSRAVRRDLADCYAMHRTVMSLFEQAEGPARQRLGVLYRLEPDRYPGRPTLLVQSASRPDFARLPAGYLSDASDNPACKDVNEAYRSLKPGTRLFFRLRANPTRRLASNGRRVEIVGEERQVAWLRRKGNQGGFDLAKASASPDVPALSTIAEPKLKGRHGGASSSGVTITLGSVVLEGILIVRETVAFQRTLEQGIGSGKAFGFGLLSLARPPCP